MKRLVLMVSIFTGCGFPPLVEDHPPQKYVVVSVFGEVMYETDDKAEAYEAAHNLTLMGRIFVSKPYYFVKESR